MLNPKSAGFLDDEQMNFQSGRIKSYELVELFQNCGIDQEKIAKYTNLTKHMPTPVLNEMAQRLYAIEAKENSRQPLRTDNLARAFARNQFERLLGNDKQKFLDEVKALVKSNSTSTILPFISYNHLKDLIPSLNNLISTVLNIAAKEIEPLKTQLDIINNQIKTDKPDGEALANLMRKRAVLIKEMELIPKNAISDLIVFNIIKPYISTQVKEDLPVLKAVLQKKLALDSTLTTQLYENYTKMQQEVPSEKKETKRDHKPLPTPEGPARQSLRK